jgi:hypothetical protein
VCTHYDPHTAEVVVVYARQGDVRSGWNQWVQRRMHAGQRMGMGIRIGACGVIRTFILLESDGERTSRGVTETGSQVIDRKVNGDTT